MDILNNLGLNSIEIEDRELNQYIKAVGHSFLFKQWQFFEENGHLNNFRILAKEINGYHSTFPLSDIEVHIWAENAFNIISSYTLDKPIKLALEKKIKEYIDLIEDSICDDGYIFTYKQICFLGERWTNLNTEHELETHAHFINAAIAHYEWTNKKDLLNLAIKSADLIVKTFKGKLSLINSGMPEIEKSLLKLYQITNNETYKNLAVEFLSTRGTIKFSGIKFVKEFLNSQKRLKYVQCEYKKITGKKIDKKLTNTLSLQDLNLTLLKLVLSGKLYQQHKSFYKIKHPTGNVESYFSLLDSYSFLDLATDNNANVRNNENILSDLLLKYMGVNGSFGTLGYVDILNKNVTTTTTSSIKQAYLIMSFCLNMFKLTKQAKYQDMIEWIFHNQILASISYEKDKFFKHNFLQSISYTQREDNIFDSYTIGYIIKSINLFKDSFILKDKNSDFFINHFTNFSWTDECSNEYKIENGFPSNFKISITCTRKKATEKTIFIRIPGWAYGFKISENKEIIEAIPNIQFEDNSEVPSFFSALYYPVHFKGKGKKVITIDLAANIRKHIGNEKDVATKNSIALSYGKLLYCMEDIDNKRVDFLNVDIDCDKEFEKEKSLDFINTVIINAKNHANKPLKFIPYYLWANRGKSKMLVWMKRELIKDEHNNRT